ncbi:DUF2461 domain-containing protein [Hymenobacter sp. ISL-91]|uniref:DUF2461 domain-containing protein n=1 Tax=Hymenobacter sp. ISL-91 TaxID=2819151 RepID=UPI001BE7FD8D|nr:DUF2461 domain-containing protein [Hymenobacter sp. ISL-91]MBT2556571.1 DUF2461 domain-containing protein [Hymenobacter sp. ISL-91]
MSLALTLSFLHDLAAHNHKTWMDEHRARYHAARAEYAAFIEELLRRATAELDPGLHGLRATDLMFRINKNDRSQLDPEPYKRHMGAGFKPGGRHAPRAGYFVAVQPGGGTYVGAGRRLPEAAELARIRQEIHYNAPAFHSMRQQPALLHHFPKGLDTSQALKTAPKGYHRTDPDIEWLRLKSYFVWLHFPDSEVLRPDFPARVLDAWQAARPLVTFLNEALEGS